MADSKRARRAARRGFATRGEERAARMRRRVVAAQTAEEQVSVAFDWFRSAVARIKDAGERAGHLREVSEFLARSAAEIDRKVVRSR